MESQKTDPLTPESYAARIDALGKNHQDALSAMPRDERHALLCELHGFAKAHGLPWPWWGAVWGRGIGRKPADRTRPKPEFDPYNPDPSRMTKDEYLHYVFDGMDGDGDIVFQPLHPDTEKRWAEASARGDYGKKPK